MAEAALQKGAKVINDISGFSFDPKIIDVVKKYDAAYVLMHMKGNPKDMQNNPYYDDVIEEIYNFLFNKLKVLKDAGISKILIDPGIGFGKRIEDNFEILKRLEDFKSLGYPIRCYLIGGIHKSLQIFFTKLLFISVCLGIDDLLFCSGCDHHECRLPSLRNSHPFELR